MSREIINRIEFTTICLSDFAQKHSLALPEAYKYLKNFGGFDYLKDCYDAAHLQSIEDNILDLTTLCSRNGGYIKPNESKFLIEMNIQDIIRFIIEDYNVEYDKAFEMFCSTQTFSKLSDVETGLYRESPAYVYEIFKNELKYGQITQIEQ